MWNSNLLVGSHNVADGIRGPIDIDQSDDARAFFAVKWDESNKMREVGGKSVLLSG